MRATVQRPTLRQIDVRLNELERSQGSADNTDKIALREFVDIVYPRYQWYRHCEVLCDALQGVAEGHRKRLMIFMPPRGGKSLLASKIFPAYCLYRMPDKWAGVTSYAAELAYTFSRSCRESYRQLGGALKTDASTIKNWETVQGGGLWAAGVGGPITGKGFGSVGLIDDPLKNAEEAASKLIREKQKEWYRSTFYTRAEPDAAIVLVQTRWHEDDLSGWLLSQEADEDPESWHILNFEAIKEATAYNFPASCTVEPDWRKLGEALCPERFSADRLRKIKKQVGSQVWTSLYQQRPSPESGEIFNRNHWLYWSALPPDSELSQWTISVDAAFKDKDTSDYVVMQVWAKAKSGFYLIDEVRDRMSFTTTVSTLRQLTRKYPKAVAKLIEDKANGTAVIDSLKREISGLIPINPTDSKLARARSISPLVEAGNIYLPSEASWVGDFVEELTAFPNGTFDDRCFAAGTLIATPLGDKPIEEIKKGDFVFTHLGIRQVVWAGKTGEKQTITKRGLIGTNNHPVYVWGEEFVRMDSLTQASALSELTICELMRHNLLSMLNSMESHTFCLEEENIIYQRQKITKNEKVLKVFMSLFGSFIAAKQYRSAFMFTIKMATRLTTTLTTLSAYRLLTTIKYQDLLRTLRSKKNTLQVYVDSLRNGINQKKVDSGTVNTVSMCGEIEQQEIVSAINVPRCSSLEDLKQRFIAAPPVAISLEELKETMTLSGNAFAAQKFSRQSCQLIQEESENFALGDVQPVFNLEVKDAHTYYANGVLVHNCDALSQALTYMYKKTSNWMKSLV